MADKREKLINDTYDASLESQKAQLEQDYNSQIADLANQQAENKQNTTANLNKTYVDAMKARRNNAEVQNAYGLSSGAAAQANAAYNTNMANNMAALRVQQQENDAQIARQRGLYADQYAAALREAQANNDYERAKNLLSLAKEREKTSASSLLSYNSGRTSGVTSLAGSGGSGATSSMYTKEQEERINKLLGLD